MYENSSANLSKYTNRLILYSAMFEEAKLAKYTIRLEPLPTIAG